MALDQSLMDLHLLCRAAPPIHSTIIALNFASGAWMKGDNFVGSGHTDCAMDPSAIAAKRWAEELNMQNILAHLQGRTPLWTKGAPRPGRRHVGLHLRVR